MTSGTLALLLIFVTSGMPADSDSGEPRRRDLLNELNAARIEAGAGPLEPHAALHDLALWRASVVAQSGSTSTAVSTINEMTRRLRRSGYDPHNWIQSVLMGGGNADFLARLKEVRPDWYEQATTGDFEHAGVGVARRHDQVAVSIVLGLRKRTVEWRRAAPLANLAWVRAIELASVNSAREEHGRPPLKSNPRLDEAAQRHAEDMLRRRYYAHESPEGHTVAHRVRAAGQKGRRAVSENLAKGLFTPEEVVHRWLNSPDHRRNILRRKAGEMGSGVAYGETGGGFEVVWVQVFADRP